jgi:hypothetical protein
MLTLNQIAEQPARAREIDRDACLQLIAEAAAVHAVLVARYSETSALEARDASDAIHVEEAAHLMGVAPKTMANGAATRYKSLRLPSLARRLVFSRRAIIEMQQDRGLELGPDAPRLLRAAGGNGRRRGRRTPTPLRQHGEGGD